MFVEIAGRAIAGNELFVTGFRTIGLESTNQICNARLYFDMPAGKTVRELTARERVLVRAVYRAAAFGASRDWDMSGEFRHGRITKRLRARVA